MTAWTCRKTSKSDAIRKELLFMVDQINATLRRIPTWLVYVLLSHPAPYFLYLGATGGLGVEPINALERKLGEVALQLIVFGLTVTPLKRWVGLNLQKFRRAIGIMAFAYVAMHLLVWLVLDVQILSQIFADLVKRPYITVGLAGFLLLVPLALTSNNVSVKKLGPKWRVLHRLTYVAAILGAAHYVMLAKGFQIEPLIYLGLILGLLALRRVPKSKSRRRAVA